MEAAPQGGPVRLYLFADTRYRLWVNGQFVAAGPARFVTGFPEYDEVDVGPWLRAGANCVAVEAHAYNGSSYQTMPDGRDGFIAWGKCGAVDFCTPGEWRVRRLDAWDENASLFTFAQNTLEICDHRRLDSAWYAPGKPDAAGWSTPRVLTNEELIWGELAPRSVPMPKFAPAEPKRIVVAGPLAKREMIFGFHFPERHLGAQKDQPTGLRQIFQTWIHSPREQEVALAQHWGEYWLNGEYVSARPWTGSGMRAEKIVRLTAGWNCLCGHVEHLGAPDFWDGVFGLPLNAGLRVSAWPKDGCKALLALAGERVPKDRLVKWLVDGRPVERAGWRDHDGDPAKITPARILGWQKLARETARDRPYAELDGAVGPEGAMWTFDFGEETLGHACIEIEGAPGQVMDIGYDEWQQPDGTIDLYRSNPFAHTVERHILRGGRQRIVALNPRGGRFVQVAVYSIDGYTGESRLHALRMLETKTLERGEATFRTDDSLDGRIWDASVMTLVGSTEDAYSDSPWRERGTYIGDFTVNQQVNRLLSADLRVARRAMRVFAQAQLESGQMPGAAPAWHSHPYDDFTLIWVIGVWEHWAMSGDLDVVAELWPTIERIWTSSVWKADSDGLWEGEGLNCFVDWGVITQERVGQATAVLNAFRIGALEKCAELARLLGKTARAEEFVAEAAAVRAAFTRVLWLPQEGRYAACRTSEGLAASTAKHANLLAWAYRIGSEEQLGRVERFLFEALDGNFAWGKKHGQFNGHIELYFFRFVLDALVERGHGQRALALVRQHWGPLVADGFGTLPECFCSVELGIGTRCHSWSGYPAVWYVRHVLGLRPEKPGSLDRWVLAPAKIAGVERAEGVLPHARGLIRARWQRGADGTIIAKIDAPAGVVVTVGP